MALTDLEANQFQVKLGELGEDGVKEQMARGSWRPETEHYRLAIDFLDQVEQERADSRAKVVLKQRIEILNVANEADRVATKANRRATLASMLAAGAFLLSVIALLVALDII